MTGLENRVVRLRERFTDAGYSGDWLEPLGELAAVTGSKSVQLVGFGGKASVRFNWVTELPPEWGEEFVAVGGADPRINSRVRVGTRSPELHIVDERDFSTAEDCQRTPDYGDWVRRWDATHTCLSNLVTRDDTLVGVCLVRRGVEGPITDEQRDVFEHLIPYLRSAVLTQLAVESRGMAMATSFLDAASACAFVCDEQGRVQGITKAAEALAAEGRWLRLKSGRLGAGSPEEERQIERLSRAVALGRPPAAGGHADMVVRDAFGAPLYLEILAAPRRHGFEFSPLALVVAHPPKDMEIGVQALSRRVYGLTPTESRVAACLAAGKSPAVTARECGVSVGTVRGHIRAIFLKVGVSSQVELVARLLATA